jgi:hypothetical protein
MRYKKEKKNRVAKKRKNESSKREIRERERAP